MPGTVENDRWLGQLSDAFIRTSAILTRTSATLTRTSAVLVLHRSFSTFDIGCFRPQASPEMVHLLLYADNVEKQIENDDKQC